MNRLGALLKTPRFWMLFATLATRGMGFLNSFLLSRLVGVQALGEYAGLVNTASAVATPFAQAVTNNATVLGAEGNRKGSTYFRALAKKNLILVAGLSIFLMGAFVLLYEHALGPRDEGGSTLFLIGGGSVVVGQMVGAVTIGFLYGRGAFVLASRLSIVAAVVVMLTIYPVVRSWGLEGALCLLLPTSLLPPLLLGVWVMRRHADSADTKGSNSEISDQSWSDAIARLVRAWPLIGASAFNNAVNWICTIYLVNRTFGTEGVGVVAVAIQWQTLMVMPATSWGGVAMKALADAAARRNVALLRHSVRDLVRKNVAVTFALALLIGLLSGAIARAYGLADTDVALLICLNGLCAVVASTYNIFERLLQALHLQHRWLLFSMFAFSSQILLTWGLIKYGLWAVPLGVLLAGMLLSLLGLLTLYRYKEKPIGNIE